jgi:D-3-phosphoglycerate dehydrogenase
MLKVLISCPPMIKQRESFSITFKSLGIEPTWAKIVQQFTEEELIDILPGYDGWIVGDDPCTRSVLVSGRRGKLKAIVKWGIGVDNVDFEACADLGIPVDNTPNMFGDEVADLAMSYITNLSRNIVDVHNGVKNLEWPKPIGTSLKSKKIGIVGLGDIGINILRRVNAARMSVIAYDPYIGSAKNEFEFEHLMWPNKIEELDYLVIARALNNQNKYMINKNIIAKFKKGIKLINVSRGPLINEIDLCEGIKNGIISGAALDVYENEPLEQNSPLREFSQIIFGTHNGSNTFEAVQKTSNIAIKKMNNFLINS